MPGPAFLATVFDTDTIGDLSVKHGTDPTTTIQGYFAHAPMAVLGGDAPDLLGETLRLALPGGTDNHLQFNSSLLRYEILTEGQEPLDFRRTTIGDDSGNRLAKILGYNYLHPNASGGSAADPYDVLITEQAQVPEGPFALTNAVPEFVVQLARDGVSKYSRPRETPDQTQRQVSVKGNAFSIGPLTYEKRFRCEAPFVPLERLEIAHAELGHPTTYEELLQTVRAHTPVLLQSTSTGSLVFKFVDADFDEQAARPQWEDYHRLFTLRIHGQVL